MIKKKLLIFMICGLSAFSLTGCNPFKFIDYVTIGEVEPSLKKESDYTLIPEEEVEKLREKQTEHFYFNQISDNKKHLYLELVYCIENEQQRILSMQDENIISEVFDDVMYDHPEYFFIDGYSVLKNKDGTGNSYVMFCGSFTYRGDMRAKCSAQIKTKTKDIIEEVKKKKSDYEKIKTIYEYLIKTTEYNLSSENNQNIVSVFLNNQSVCQGYAKAFQYICQNTGIECIFTPGKLTHGEAHAFNIVKSDGDYYFVDVTLGDASYAKVKNGISYKVEDLETINYNYLLITEEELLKTHLPIGNPDLPKCTATKDNYYVREKYYMDDFKPEYFGEMIDRKYQNGEKILTVKFGNAKSFADGCKYLIEEKHLFDYLKEDGSIEFSKDESNRSLTVFLEYNNSQEDLKK